MRFIPQCRRRAAGAGIPGGRRGGSAVARARRGGAGPALPARRGAAGGTGRLSVGSCRRSGSILARGRRFPGRRALAWPAASPSGKIKGPPPCPGKPAFPSASVSFYAVAGSTSKEYVTGDRESSADQLRPRRVSWSGPKETERAESRGRCAAPRRSEVRLASRPARFVATTDAQGPMPRPDPPSPALPRARQVRACFITAGRERRGRRAGRALGGRGRAPAPPAGPPAGPLVPFQ